MYKFSLKFKNIQHLRIDICIDNEYIIHVDLALFHGTRTISLSCCRYVSSSVAEVRGTLNEVGGLGPLVSVSNKSAPVPL